LANNNTCVSRRTHTPTSCNFLFLQAHIVTLTLEEFAKAIENDDLSMVKWFISRRLVDVNARLPCKSRPPALVLAARNGRKKIVRILLRAYARVDKGDKRGRTACHAAVEGGHSDVLALLLARQPNLAAVDVDGRTAFHTAMIWCGLYGDRSAVMLFEAGAPLDKTALRDFAATSTAAIQALLDRGVVVRKLRCGGDTPLHAAAREGLTDTHGIFDMLVNVCGINLEARDYGGQTCVCVAAEFGNFFALRWLLNAGADANAVASDGSMALHSVVPYRCAVILLAAGADVCARNNRGRTALHPLLKWAAKSGRPVAWTAVPHLLAAGADLDAADNNGETARAMLARLRCTIDPGQVEQARREISKARIDFVRDRARQVCIGLQSLRIDALQMCEVLQFACGAIAPLIPFHIWWKIATTVKHFRTK
jgi:ankyrin repeat protein